MTIDAWPSVGFALLNELEGARGRVALIAAASPGEADRLVERLRTDLGVDVVRLGRALADVPQPPSLTDVESACGGATVITDLDVLLWHPMNIAALPLLAARARRRRPTVAVWPGHIASDRATYSALGRDDYQDIPLRDVVVLRPRGTRFPDEVPFTIERIFR